MALARRNAKHVYPDCKIWKKSARAIRSFGHFSRINKMMQRTHLQQGALPRHLCALPLLFLPGPRCDFGHFEPLSYNWGRRSEQWSWPQVTISSECKLKLNVISNSTFLSHLVTQLSLPPYDNLRYCKVQRFEERKMPVHGGIESVYRLAQVKLRLCWDQRVLKQWEVKHTDGIPVRVAFASFLFLPQEHFSGVGMQRNASIRIASNWQERN